jgi:tripartite-type tricarboxylate transporter receptor subunit TctC
MKRILAIILLFYTAISSATDQNFVWVAQSGGSQESQCRAVWKEYDSLYNTSTVVISGVSGLGGGLAVNEMLKSTYQNKFICLGLGQYLLNHAFYPGQTKENQLTPVITTSRIPIFWYVPNGNITNNYQEMLSYFRSLNRPINVGILFPSLKYVVPILEQQGIAVNSVTYKTGPQQYPSLADGTLDLAFDAGPGVQVALQTKKFRVAGYVDSSNHGNLINLNNFIWDEPNLAAMSAFSNMLIAMPEDISNDTRKLLGQRLKKVVQSERFKSVVATFNGHPTGLTENSLQQYIELQQRTVLKYWK